MPNLSRANERRLRRLIGSGFLILSFSAFGQSTQNVEAPASVEAPPEVIPPPSGMLRASGATDFSPEPRSPQVPEDSYVHPRATLIGDVQVGEAVFFGPQVSVRGDEGYAISIGSFSNLQDGVVIHAMEVEASGQPLPGRAFSPSGERGLIGEEYPYAVYISSRVTLSPLAQVHGPAWIGEGTWVGSGALIFNARVGAGCVIEPGAQVIDVDIPPQRIVRAGQVISRQDMADRLPLIEPDSLWREIVAATLETYQQLTEGYAGRFDPGLPEEVLTQWRVAPKSAAILPSVPIEGHLSVELPEVDAAAKLDPRATLIGDVRLGAGSTVGLMAVLRADVGAPIALSGAVVEPGAVLVAAKRASAQNATQPESTSVPTSAPAEETEGIFLGQGAVIGPRAQVYGASRIGAGARLGAQAIVVSANIGEGSFISAGAVVVGVDVPPGRLVEPGKIILTESDAAALPAVPAAEAPTTEAASEPVSIPASEPVSAPAPRPAPDRFEADPLATVVPEAKALGRVTLGAEVFVAPYALLASAPSYSVKVGNLSNVQDGVVLYASGGDVEIADAVSVTHQAVIVGPATLEEGAYIGMQALIADARIGQGVVVEPGAIIMGVDIPEGRYVPAGMVVTPENVATLPAINEEYVWWNINEESVFINTSFAAVYADTPREAVFRPRPEATPEEEVVEAEPSFWDFLDFLDPLWTEEGILISFVVLLILGLGAYGLLTTRSPSSQREE